MATVRLPEFKGGAGLLPFPRGVYPRDQKWSSFRRDLAYAYAFNLKVTIRKDGVDLSP